MAVKFETLQAISSTMGEDKDCAVKAVAVVAGIPYMDAHTLLKRFGRKDKKGTPFKATIHPALESLGAKLIKINLKGATLRTLNVPHAGKYLILVKGHILAAKDGEIIDWSVGRCFRVREVYKVVL